MTINAIQTDAASTPATPAARCLIPYGNVIGMVLCQELFREHRSIGYAIPVNNIKDLVAQMINDPDSVKDQTKGSQIMLGITIRDIHRRHEQAVFHAGRLCISPRFPA